MSTFCVCQKYVYCHRLDLMCCIFYHRLPFYHISFHYVDKPCLILNIAFLRYQFSFFNSLPNWKCSYLVAFSTSPSSGKTFPFVKNSYLSTFHNNNTKNVSYCLYKSYWALFCSVMLSVVLLFYQSFIIDHLMVKLYRY